MTPQEARQALPELAEWVDGFRAFFDDPARPDDRCRVLYLAGRGIQLGKPQPQGVPFSAPPPKPKGRK